jgi:hypothetical protein
MQQYQTVIGDCDCVFGYPGTYTFILNIALIFHISSSLLIAKRTVLNPLVATLDRMFWEHVEALPPSRLEFLVTSMKANAPRPLYVQFPRLSRRRSRGCHRWMASPLWTSANWRSRHRPEKPLFSHSLPTTGASAVTGFPGRLFRRTLEQYARIDRGAGRGARRRRRAGAR